MTTTTLAYDAMGVNAQTMPAGQHCGYTTGSSWIQWQFAQWAADPGAVRICQDAGASDATADVLDVESGAAVPSEVPGWVTRARASYAAATRPGQRAPTVYCSRSSLTPVANALSAANITGVPIWLADPNLSQVAAQDMILTASGPYPVLGVQFAWHNTFDADVFSSEWLAGQSGVKGSTIRESNSGPAVLAAQKLLNAAGIKLAEDGLFGVGTLGAVKLFQKKKGLPQDGVVGPDTWKALEGSTPPPPPPPPPVTLETHTVKGTLVRVTGTTPVYWWNGTNLWHIPDAVVFAFMEKAGFGSIKSVTGAQLKKLGSVV